MPHGPEITCLRDAEFGFGLLPWAQGPLWQIDADYTFIVKAAQRNYRSGPYIHEISPERSYTIPAGYQFDKASIPPLFWGPPFNYTPDGLCVVPALEHDFLCDLLTGGSYWLVEKLGTLPFSPPAWAVHGHFYRRLLICGVRPRKAALMGRAVAAFGPQGWARFSSLFNRFFKT